MVIAEVQHGGVVSQEARTDISNSDAYTMKMVHEAIPKHCFRPDTWTSLSIVARDLALVLALVGLATFIPSISSPSVRFGAWSVYGFCQGLVLTGLWELAHESGHRALSPHRWVNDAIGMSIHSLLLVPFHSWRFTHQTHHKSTNHLDRDIAFIPEVKDTALAEMQSGTFDKIKDIVADCPAVTLIVLFVHQLIAFPLYLTINNLALERMRNAAWYQRSHFYAGGDGPNFKPRHTRDIILSDITVGMAFFMLWVAKNQFGSWNVCLFYFLPYLWTNHWILTITFLQHTDVTVPYYSKASWSFLRGAAATIDRDFGFIGRYLFHGAIETHVLHHHASGIPCYHAAEATEAIRPVMGSSYQRDAETPYLVAFWNNYRSCKYVSERQKDAGVFVYDGKVDHALGEKRQGDPFD